MLFLPLALFCLNSSAGGEVRSLTLKRGGRAKCFYEGKEMKFVHVSRPGSHFLHVIKARPEKNEHWPSEIDTLCIKK